MQADVTIDLRSCKGLAEPTYASLTGRVYFFPV